ncbi:MAG: hypothetical protein IKK04_09070 [Bacteroidales bacterium]|nr:hypothetical protein [Bacteroidales bacterium]
MNVLKRAVMVAVALIAFDTAEAQYTFSAQIVISGKCFSQASNMAERNIRQVVNEVNAKLKAVPLTKAECMAMSQQFAGELAVYSFSEHGCSIKLVITPCICTGCQEEASNPDQGGSFNSANASSEVKDWADDVAARQRALNQHATPPPSQVEAFFGKGTGDKQFDDALKKGLGAFELPNNAVKLPDDFELLANMENVQRYLSMTSNLAERYINYPDPDHLVAWFHEEFKNVSDFDLGEIMNKLESQRSPAEKQALLDYQAFRRLLADKMINQIEEIRQAVARSEETRAYEMAVLSENCYGDSKHEYLANTNYREVGTIDFLEGDPMRSFSAVIDECNKSLGFHAELYYNTVTGEYAVALEGSNMHPIGDLREYLSNWKNVVSNRMDFIADWGANVKQGLGGIPEQYVLAYIIAKSLPEGVKVNFTGHSLGGGLASVAGAVSGAPTYTYNPEGVNNNIIDAFGIREKVEARDYNIKVYQANNDLLTSVQEGVLKDAVLGVVKTIDPVGGIFLSQQAKKGNAISSAIGSKETIDSGGWHKIEPMIQYLGKSYDWNQSLYGIWQKSVYQAGHSTEQQTEDHILIIWPE